MSGCGPPGRPRSPQRQQLAVAQVDAVHLAVEGAVAGGDHPVPATCRRPGRAGQRVVVHDVAARQRLVPGHHVAQLHDTLTDALLGGGVGQGGGFRHPTRAVPGGEQGDPVSEPVQFTGQLVDHQLGAAVDGGGTGTQGGASSPMLRLVLDMPRSWCDARSGRLDPGARKAVRGLVLPGPRPGDLRRSRAWLGGPCGRAGVRSLGPVRHSGRPLTMAGPVSRTAARGGSHVQFEEFVNEVADRAGTRPNRSSAQRCGRSPSGSPAERPRTFVLSCPASSRQS